MDLTALTALSPADGRYRRKTEDLAPFFSEWGLIRYRLQIEVEYFIRLCQIPLPQLKAFPTEKFQTLQSLYLSFGPDDALRVKEIESITNHDVKAVEYYLKEQFEQLELSDYKEFIHFGLTSQDVNNTATPLSLKDGITEVYLPKLEHLTHTLREMAREWKDVPMLAKTHGQPASPTRLGKELLVFVDRLDTQLKQLRVHPYPAKFGGATGNFNAHVAAYPQIDWVNFANELVNQVLGLNRSQITTQIEHYDNLASLFDLLRRIHVILIDFSRDVWMYISMNYFRQSIKKGEVGSSAMPHKVNPIDFENAEGNLGLANALLDHLSNKLPVSRLQRDLTDSTVLRNIGLPLAHGLVAVQSLLKGLKKLSLNETVIHQDLENNWAVIAEALQTILRREKYPDPYETLLKLTRKNEQITRETLHTFIDELNVTSEVKEELKLLTPHNYTGVNPFT